MRLGMVGLGRMGANMARRLIRGGHEVVVTDLTPEAVKQMATEFSKRNLHVATISFNGPANDPKQQAKVLYRGGLSRWRDLHRVEQRIGIVKALAGLAEVVVAQGQAERAGRLFGAAARLLPSTSSYREEVNRRIAAARAQLDAATFEVGWAAGQAMTEEQAITEALQNA